jgi:hypothetical protein
MIEDHISFDLKFPMNWGLPKSITTEDGIIPFESGQTEKKGISFVCPFNDKDVQLTISKITKVIKLNRDKEMKERLFKETIDTLKKTFETTDLETLKRLYFDFESDKLKTSEENGEDGGTTLELVEERTTERPKRVRARKIEDASGDKEIE